MDIGEFRDLGFLQEANRLFFHPRGLALEIVVEPCNCDNGLIEAGPAGATYSAPCPRCDADYNVARLGGIWDYRDDPEGILYGEDQMDSAKAERVSAELEKHRENREELMGRVIQPTDFQEPGECPMTGVMGVHTFDNGACIYCGVKDPHD